MQGGTGRSPRRLRRRCGRRPQKPPCRAVWAAPACPPAGACPDEIRPSVPPGESSLPAGACPFPARRAFRLRRNRGLPAAGPYACLRQAALRARPLHQLSPQLPPAPTFPATAPCTNFPPRKKLPRCPAPPGSGAACLGRTLISWGRSYSPTAPARRKAPQ